MLSLVAEYFFVAAAGLDPEVRDELTADPMAEEVKAAHDASTRVKVLLKKVHSTLD